jgi:hypothetical protein
MRLISEREETRTRHQPSACCLCCLLVRAALRWATPVLSFLCLHSRTRVPTKMPCQAPGFKERVPFATMMRNGARGTRPEAMLYRWWYARCTMAAMALRERGHPTDLSSVNTNPRMRTQRRSCT